MMHESSNRFAIGKYKRVAAFLVLGALLLALSPQSIQAQDRLTATEKRELRKIRSGITRAGKLYENQNFKRSAELIIEIGGQLEALVQGDVSPALLDQVKPLHQQLVSAREALVKAGQTIPRLAALPNAGKDPDAAVSFTNDVAKILNSRCGACHVQRSRGNFSMANFNALASGVQGAPVVVPGKPDESRLVEAIEEGAMPPNGNGIPQAELEILKKWISDNAKFDGQDRTASLANMARATQATLQVRRPVGDETVSFSRDVAPVLMENCMGCHYEPRNVRGGLRMDTFQQILRGGESGPMIVPGDSKNSGLMQRLTAKDRNTRMPRGRNPLNKMAIDRIATWIDEGARFDGRTDRMNLRQVSAIANSEAASHDELSLQRQQAALRDWKKVMSDVQAITVARDDFWVVAAKGSRGVDAVADLIQGMSSKIRKELNLKSSQPLVKGKVTVYLFQRRYDYSEFGKMIESRDLPKSRHSHWNYDSVNAYAAVLMSETTELDQLKPELLQRVSAVTVASLGPDVPDWFANGVGYRMAAKLAGDKSAVDRWKEESAKAISEMTDPTDFLRGRIDDDRSGLIAYAFVESLAAMNRKEFAALLEQITSGGNFQAIFKSIWAMSPTEMFQRQKLGNQRGRRSGRDRGRQGRRQ